MARVQLPQFQEAPGGAMLGQKASSDKATCELRESGKDAWKCLPGTHGRGFAGHQAGGYGATTRPRIRDAIRGRHT